MLKLLLRQDRLNLRSEYQKRFANLTVLVFALALSYFGILLYSVNIYINAEKKIEFEKSEQIKESETKKEQIELQKRLDHLKAEINLFKRPVLSPSVVLTEVLKSQNQGIGITTINLSAADLAETPGQEVDVEIRGMSKTREDLVNFSKSLESNEKFSGINVPFSSLARGSDIPFSITIKALIKDDE